MCKGIWRGNFRALELDGVLKEILVEAFAPCATLAVRDRPPKIGRAFTPAGNRQFDVGETDVLLSVQADWQPENQTLVSVPTAQVNTSPEANPAWRVVFLSSWLLGKYDTRPKRKRKMMGKRTGAQPEGGVAK